LNMCRAYRAREGIRSARFYWHQTEIVVLLVEGDLNGFTAPADANYARVAFELADLARRTMYMRLTDPREGQETYHLAGR